MNKPAQVEVKDDKVVISIDREALESNQLDSASLFEYLNLAISLAGNNLNNASCKVVESDGTISENRPKVGVFMESSIHYSGGRYWILLSSKLLSSVCDVTVFTNRRAIWHKIVDNISIDGNFEIVVNPAFRFDFSKYKFDLVVGTPKLGIEIARMFPDRDGVPMVAHLFESPNYVRSMLGPGSQDGDASLWAGYKNAANWASKIICLSNVATSYAKTWLEDEVSADNFIYVYPCINEPVAKAVLMSNPQKENSIVFLSRQSGHKMPIHELEHLAKITDNPPKIYILGFRASMAAAKLRGYKGEVVVDEAVGEEEKFSILARSKVLIYPSRFDGFGIPPMEALYVGTPVVAYGIPVIKEVYEDAAHYADVGDSKTLIELAMKIVRGESDYDVNKARDKIMRFATIESGRRRVVGAMFPQKLSVGIIAFHCADTIEHCLRHIYDIADEIIVVEGAVEDFMFAANEDGSSKDETVEKIKQFPDPKNKIRLTRGRWKNKEEMQNVIAEQVTGAIYMKLDADEFYHEQELIDILDMFRRDKDLQVVKVGMYHFWKGDEIIATGGQWDGTPARFFRWDSAYRHIDSFNYFRDEKNEKVPGPKYKERILLRTCYHLSYARSSNYVLEKLSYYSKRGIERNVVDTWTNWKWGEPTQPTHGGGSAEIFRGNLPLEVRAFFDKGKEK